MNEILTVVCSIALWRCFYTVALSHVLQATADMLAKPHQPDANYTHHQAVQQTLAILSICAFCMILTVHSACCPTQISQIGLMETQCFL
jgi:hypothetical protein